MQGLLRRLLDSSGEALEARKEGGDLVTYERGKLPPKNALPSETGFHKQKQKLADKS